MKSSDNKSQHGTVAVEFGIVLPILMLTLFGITQFGTAYYKQQVLTAAVREGARMGVVAISPRPSTNQIQQKVLAYLSDVGWDVSKAAVSVSGAQQTSGSALTVQATYPTSLGVVSKLVQQGSIPVDANGDVSLKAKVVMEIE